MISPDERKKRETYPKLTELEIATISMIFKSAIDVTRQTRGEALARELFDLQRKIFMRFSPHIERNVNADGTRKAGEES